MNENLEILIEIGKETKAEIKRLKDFKLNFTAGNRAIHTQVIAGHINFATGALEKCLEDIAEKIGEEMLKNE